MYNKAEKQQNLFNQSHRVHITPLVIYALGGGHTRIHPHISNLKKPGVRLVNNNLEQMLMHGVCVQHTVVYTYIQMYMQMYVHTYVRTSDATIIVIYDIS